MFQDVENKIKKKNKILFNRESEALQDLRYLISRQNHITLVLWAFDCLKTPVKELMEKYPEEKAIQETFDLSLAWAHGQIKMPQAKKTILACHAVAKKLTDEVEIALCHAIGQGCGTVHVETHALCLPFYELTAIVIKSEYVNYQDEVLSKIDFYMKKLKWWQENSKDYIANETWADFLLKPGKVNKEAILLSKIYGDVTI